MLCQAESTLLLVIIYVLLSISMLTSQVMKEHSITALPISSLPGKWLGVGGTNIVDECRQYIVSERLSIECIVQGLW